MSSLEKFQLYHGKETVIYQEFFEGVNHPIYCNLCFEVISGPAYLEVEEGFQQYWHKSCAELPDEIQHPLHPQHPLTAFMRQSRPSEHYDFICDGCRHYSCNFRYHCEECNFKLDIRCVSKLESQQLAPKERIERDTAFHKHKLQRFHHNMLLSTEVLKRIICCCCSKGFQDSAYACIKCELLIHESCIDKVPQQVRTPFHLEHPLLLRQPYDYKICLACTGGVHGLMLSCEQCDCSYHISCCTHATSGLRLKCHEQHLMFYVFRTDKIFAERMKCVVCNTTCENCASYSCLDCRVFIHMECIPLPRIVKHECHPYHALTLSDSTHIPKITFNEYHCVVCEKEGDIKYPFYYCEECPDIAHIDCVLSKKDPPSEVLEYLVPRSCQKYEFEKETYDYESELDNKYDNSEHKNVKRPGFVRLPRFDEVEIATPPKKLPHGYGVPLSQMEQLEQIYGKDRLIYYEFYEGINHPVYCHSCCEVISGPAYVVYETLTIAMDKIYPYVYGVHKSCAELPSEIQYPLHPQHSLTAVPLRKRGDSFKAEPLDATSNGFICDGCRHYSWGLKYWCDDCNFKLDVRCVSKCESQQLPLQERKEIATAFHEHKLQRFFYNMLLATPFFTDIFCCFCSKGFQGSAYACTKCQLFIHESCLDKVPQQVRSWFHPQHPIVLCKPCGRETCQACEKPVRGLMLSCECERCFSYFHISCCTHTTSGLRLKYHEEHPMHYRDTVTSRRCIVCNNKCKDCATYSCLDCGVYVHLECIPLPRVVKHECHPYHAFTLSDSTHALKVASTEYRCIVCEKEVDLKHPFYYCEECQDIAHIDCVLSEEDPPSEILEYLVPKSPKDYDSDDSNGLLLWAKAQIKRHNKMKQTSNMIDWREERVIIRNNVQVVKFSSDR